MLRKRDIFLDGIAAVVPNVKTAYCFDLEPRVVELPRRFKNPMRGLVTLDFLDLTRCGSFFASDRIRNTDSLADAVGANAGIQRFAEPAITDSQAARVICLVPQIGP